ncbi:MAG: hypothetical protein WCZ87_13120 [Thiohalobacteraceae bacterium]
METLINPSFVIPAKAGIQKFKDMDSGLRRNDGLFRASLCAFGAFVVTALKITDAIGARG